MGNIISVQCGDALVCTAKKSKLEESLVDLQAATNQLTELRIDVMRAVENIKRWGMDQPHQVVDWLSRVDDTIDQATELLSRGAPKRQNLCMAGPCSSNSMSTGRIRESVAQILIEANSLVAPDFSLVAVDPRKLENGIENLKNERTRLQTLKEGLQARIFSEGGREKRTLKQVQLWLSMVETCVAEADQLIENRPQEVKTSLSGDLSNYMFVKRVAQKLEDIASLHSKGDFKEVTAKAVPRRVFGRNLELAVGTQEMLEEALSVLYEAEVGILGIYGMGGVGKTTLLTLINSQFESEPYDFDVVIWVVVSRNFKPDNIQESIWKQIQSFDDRWLQKSFKQKAQDIFDVLQEKKFLLLLDDVWQQFDLQEFGVPPTNRNGSKVVLTTRFSAVCQQMGSMRSMEVKPLNREAAWHLFKEMVGEIHEDISETAHQVAEGCCRLPLALITIGRAMAERSSHEEWVHALNVLRRSVSNLQGMEDELYQEMEVGMFQRLKFSYDCLPNNTLQSCFLYCALFPEDFKVLKDDLVHYWVAEKFCSPREGYHIVYTLIRRCLLEEEGECVKLHDVIRDMAVWIACKCEKQNRRFFMQAGAQFNELLGVEEWEREKKVSFVSNSFASIEGSPPSSDLVTLFLSYTNLNFISEGFFQIMTTLAVLDLSHSRIKALPLAVTKLQSLEYLNLSYTNLVKLPVEMKSLIRLKYLNLEGIYCLLMIPVQVISNLSELQVLNMLRCASFFYDNAGDNESIVDENRFIEELVCLKNLCELSLTVSSASFLQSICSNQKLLDCMRALQLCISQDTKSLNISSLAKAKQLHLLDIFVNQNLEELTTEASEPHGPSSSLDNNQLSFCGLREVNVINNNSMLHMTWLIFAPNLSILRAKNNEKMEEIISAEKLSGHQVWGEHLNMFEKLQVLDLEWLTKLKSIFPRTLSFPCLTQMNVRECPALKKLPLKSEREEECNVVIRGERSWWNELTWEDHQTQAAFSSSFRKIPFF